MGYVLGIDLGTTFTAAAVGEAGSVEIYPLSDQAHVIPSVLVLRADGEVLVGEVAQRRAVTEPARAAREFKRRLGDPTPLLLGGTPYGADALMAMLLRAVVDQVATIKGEPPELVCLTHPASYGEYKQDLLRQVAQQANVPNWVLTTEPQAAAVNHAASERVTPGDVLAVYDLGGGTFDAALVRAEEGGSFRLLGTPEGLERIGGIDFDQAVLAHVDAAVDGQIGELDLTDPVAAGAVARLRLECRMAKEALSADNDVSIPVMLPNLSTEVRLRRSEFEAMIRPRVDDTIDALSRAVRSAGLGVEDLAATLLVGGSSRIPLVRERVRELTDRPIALDAHPKHSIALGAARVALAGGAPTVAAAPEPAAEVAPLPEDTQQAAAVVPVAVPPAEAPPAAPVSQEPETISTPVVAAPAPAAAPVAEPAAPAPAKRRSRVPLVAALVLVAAVLGGVLFVVLTKDEGDDGGSADTAQGADQPPADDEGGDEPSATTVAATGGTQVLNVPSGTEPFRLVATDAGVFVTNAGDARVVQLDPTSGELLNEFDLGGEPAGIDGDGTAVWASNFDTDQVVRIDLATGEMTPIDVGAGPRNVAVNSTAVWVADIDDDTVTQIDMASASVVNQFPVGGAPRGIAATDDAVWVSNSDDGTVTQIDPVNGVVVATVDVGGNPGGVAITDGAVWVTDSDTDTVIRIDPATQSVAQTTAVGTDPGGMTTDGTYVYVSNSGDDTVAQIDASTGEVVDLLTTGDGPAGLDVSGAGLWVANNLDGTVSLITPG
jgi:YVTN family beta-propeller protein